jgi:hypothetical protein
MHTSRTPGALSVHDIPKLRIPRSFSTPTQKLFSDASQKRYLEYQPSGRARENSLRDDVTIPGAQQKIKQEIL